MVLALSRKGQISIEFILIVTIALFYIGATVLPIVTDSANSASDVKAVADTTLSATKIANTLNEAASSSGDMKKTVSIVLLASSKISCDGVANMVNYDVNVTASGGNPDELNCHETGPLNYECSSSVPLVSGASTAFEIRGPLLKKVIVEKDSGIISVS